MSGRAAKLTCDRGIIGIIGIISIIGIVGIIGIIGIIDIIRRSDGQGGPHYCSRRTVLFCTKEHGFSHLACVFPSSFATDIICGYWKWS